MDCFAGQAVFGGHIPRWAKTMRWEGADIFLRYHRDNILGIIRNPTAMSVSEQAIPLRKQIDCQGHWNIYNVCREQWDKSIMFQDNFLYLKYFKNYLCLQSIIFFELGIQADTIPICVLDEKPYLLCFLCALSEWRIIFAIIHCSTK